MWVDKNNVNIVQSNKETVYNIVKKSHGDYPQKYAKLSPTEAELVKYYSNVYNAMRVTFANSIYEIC